MEPLTSTPTTPATEESNDPVVIETPAPEPVPASAHPDPITGEPGAHPVGVGVGALGAGAAGAAIGSIGGPIGMLIGAAIGAVAGGLAGKEVATSSSAPTEDGATTTDKVGADLPVPNSPSSLPGEEFRATNGSAFAADGDLLPIGGSGLLGATMEDTHDDTSPAMPLSGEEAVRVAAYYHFVHRTTIGAPGDAVSDWLEAEREMMLG